MVNWEELQSALYPIPSYEDLSRRWREGFSYDFVLKSYNFSMPEMADYTTRLLGGDTRHRYDRWAQQLVGIFQQLDRCGVTHVRDLVKRVDTRRLFEGFCNQSGVAPGDLINVLKYLVYWFIPMKKYLKVLVKRDPHLVEAVDQLRQAGIRFNLDLIEAGATPDRRCDLAEMAGLDEDQVSELVNWADFSRLPWASAATTSNIVGAGYGSIARLAAADLEQVKEKFFRYGESIHKNLKFGNEIESSHRVARIVPKVVVE